MCFQKRDVKFKGHRGVLITTAALNKILEHEKRVFLFHTKKNCVVVDLCFTLKWSVVMFYILCLSICFLNRFTLIGWYAICVGKHTNVSELLHHLSWFSKHWFCLYNFLSLLKLPYILCFAYISQSLEKGHFPVKSHELPVFIDISFFFLVSIQLEEEMWEQAVPAADKDLQNFPPSTYGTGPLTGKRCYQGSLQKLEHPPCLPTTGLRNLTLSKHIYFVQ